MSIIINKTLSKSAKWTYASCISLLFLSDRDYDSCMLRVISWKQKSVRIHREFLWC